MLKLRALSTMATAAVAFACGDSPTGPSADSSYVLVSVDGSSVPAATDSTNTMDGTTVLTRIVSRSVAMFSADSAVYLRASDTIEREQDGTHTVLEAECIERRVRWQRDGVRLLLTAPPYIPPPSTGILEPQPAINETLLISGSRLRHSLQEPPTSTHPDGRTLELEYRSGPAPTC